MQVSFPSFFLPYGVVGENSMHRIAAGWSAPNATMAPRATVACSAMVTTLRKNIMMTESKCGNIENSFLKDIWIIAIIGFIVS
jgi:hypothetical protein